MSRTTLLLTLALAGLAALPAFAAEHDAEVNGIRMHYQVLGSGEPLLLLHGFGACGDDWSDFLPALSKQYRLIVPDLRGHGASTNPSGKFTMRDSASDVLALLDYLDIPRTRAIGISGGGMTLLHVATRDPGRLQALVLVGASTHFPAETRHIAAGVPGNLPPFLLEMYRACATRGQAQVDELLAQFRGFKDSYEDMSFTAPHLGTITARTLIVHGDRDEFFPVQIPVDMYKAIPGSALWIVPEGDHVPIYGERQPEFLRVVTAFLPEPTPS